MIKILIADVDTHLLKLVDPARCILYRIALRYASGRISSEILAQSSVTRREATLRVWDNVGKLTIIPDSQGVLECPIGKRIFRLRMPRRLIMLVGGVTAHLGDDEYGH